MKMKINIIFVLIFALRIDIAEANTLLDSLNSAYLKNPNLNAERASMRASKEEKRESISEFLPSVQFQAMLENKKIPIQEMIQIFVRQNSQ